jgi:hypothetical protein
MIDLRATPRGSACGLAAYPWFRSSLLHNGFPSSFQKAAACLDLEKYSVQVRVWTLLDWNERFVSQF